MPAVALPAVSILCTNSVPVPADSVTPLADHDDPGPTVASTQVVPPLALTWIFSPAPSAPVNVPLTVCDATLVMKSPAVPVSALSAVTVATALGGVASTMRVCALVVVLALPARSVTVTLRLL